MDTPPLSESISCSSPPHSPVSGLFKGSATDSVYVFSQISCSSRKLKLLAERISVVQVIEVWCRQLACECRKTWSMIWSRSSCVILLVICFCSRVAMSFLVNAFTAGGPHLVQSLWCDEGSNMRAGWCTAMCSHLTSSWARGSSVADLWEYLWNLYVHQCLRCLLSVLKCTYFIASFWKYLRSRLIREVAKQSKCRLCAC